MSLKNIQKKPTVPDGRVFGIGFRGGGGVIKYFLTRLLKVHNHIVMLMTILYGTTYDIIMYTNYK